MPQAGAEEGYTSAEFHPDGLILGTGTSNSLVRMWEARQSKVREPTYSPLPEQRAGVQSVCMLGLCNNSLPVSIGAYHCSTTAGHVPMLHAMIPLYFALADIDPCMPWLPNKGGGGVSHILE